MSKNDQVLKDIADSKKEFTEMCDAFDAFKIEEKTIKEWHEYFRVTIPPDADTTICKQIASNLGKLHHLATYYFNKSASVEKAFSIKKDREYMVAYNKKVKEYKDAGKSLPAAKTLETGAKEAVRDLDNVISNAELAKDFWRKKIEHLKFMHKLLNDVTINNGYEIKLGPLGT